MSYVQTVNSSGEGATSPSAERVALCLSGGGFRATFFHLGVLRSLRDSGWLTRITDVFSISGGSIIAAHLAVNWDRYVHSNVAEFEAAGEQLIRFGRADVRGRVVRLMFLGRTRQLQHCYTRLLGDVTLPSLRRANVRFYLIATNMTTGEPCWFAADGVSSHERATLTIGKSYAAELVPVAFAVAASSAYPVLFPPLKITTTQVAAPIEALPVGQHLTDGGVFDNLALNAVRRVHADSPFRSIIVSDASAPLDWALGGFTTLMRMSRATDVLMTRVALLEEAALEREARPPSTRILRIGLDPTLQGIRTDLNAFSRMEIRTLIYDGCDKAWGALEETATCPGLTWHPCRERPIDRLKDRLAPRRRRRRPFNQARRRAEIRQRTQKLQVRSKSFFGRLGISAVRVLALLYPTNLKRPLLGFKDWQGYLDRLMVLVMLLGAVGAAWATSSWIKRRAPSYLAELHPADAISDLIEQRRELPKAGGNRFAVAVLHLHDDDHARNHETMVLNALAEIDGLEVLSVPRTVRLRRATDARLAHDEARGYGRQIGAQVAIWGSVVEYEGQSVPQLYLTSSDRAAEPRLYQPTPELRLPADFRESLVEALQLVILTEHSVFSKQRGQAVPREEMALFLGRARELLRKRQRRGWTPAAESDIRAVFADSLVMAGEQTGQSELLDEAIAEYQSALRGRSKDDDAALEWARLKSGLGRALLRRGEKESTSHRLERSVMALRESLEVQGREAVPQEWALTQHVLGSALVALSQRKQPDEAGPMLDQAEEAFRAALTERTKEGSRIDWAVSQTNLGIAQWRRGKLMKDREALVAAVDSLREASHELRDEKTAPLPWAGATASLAAALQDLGEIDGDVSRLEEAVVAFRAVLGVRTRETVPIEWAKTQNNLGDALRVLGTRQARMEPLEEAVAAYRAAIDELKREPMYRALVRLGLAQALAALGNLGAKDPRRLGEAVDEFASAWRELSEQGSQHAGLAAKGVKDVLWQLKQRSPDLERAYRKRHSSILPRL